MSTRILAFLLAGVFLATAFAALARSAGPRRAPRIHVAALVVAGLIYVGFALVAGDVSGLVVEAAGTAALLGLAVLAYRRGSARIFALGWALHPFWDVGLHTGGTGGYAPFAYVATCIGFDFLLAALLVRGRAGIPASPSPSP